MVSLFGSTYCRELFFNEMYLSKARCRSLLADEHLTSQLIEAATPVKTDIDKLYTESKFQVPH